MIDNLVDCCNERLSLGQSDIKQLSWLNLNANMYVIIVNVGNPLSICVWLHGSWISESGQIHLYVLRDRMGALSTRLTLHGIRRYHLPQKPRCVYSHPVASVQNDTAGSLHRAFSHGIRESLIEIQLKTQDDHVCVRIRGCWRCFCSRKVLS